MTFSNDPAPEQMRIFDMIPHKLILASIILISFFGKVAVADCYYIRLSGYHVTQESDIFSWGELSPLIGLEAGYYFHLAPVARLQSIFPIGKPETCKANSIIFRKASLTKTSNSP